ncbi:hypothetical protein DF185_07740 [Marinifilum breve]|uniref:Thioredoxin domain-containing protein n=2 Tax=Marinifilum breve TaxID=2184082 RepID=A0A2V3ZY32_9BACT|nr:hypothetical protein DF185_07740 [Marinifilum breve]
MSVIATILLVVMFINTAYTEMKTESVKDRIVNAQAEGNSVLVVAYDSESEKKKEVMNMVLAVAKESKGVSVVGLDVSKNENEDLVGEYSLKRVPMPVVLIIDKHGLLVGGLTSVQVNEKRLKTNLPTPCYSDLLKNIHDDKATIVVAYTNGMEEKEKAIALSKDANEKLGHKSGLIELDVNDEDEKNFVDILRVNGIAKSTILVINSQGQLTGRFMSDSSIDEIREAALRVVRSGCGCG